MKEVSVLHQIAESVEARLEERKRLLNENELRALCEAARTPHDFKEAFQRPGVNVIAEVKFASPSQGALARGRASNPVETAGGYLRSGARAISVLTEQDHFNGNLQYLSQIRKVFPDARLLMKDFVIDEYQLLEARANGADAALLIVALLGKARTSSLLAECRKLGLAALVEVHDEAELEIAAQVGADLIGINNRNLKTLKISLETSLRLAPLAPQGATLISESGISLASEIMHLRESGFSGFLIGTSFMKSGNPGAALAALLKESL
jgi:indole-3-glycerol phosphate synthase